MSSGGGGQGSGPTTYARWREQIQADLLVEAWPKNPANPDIVIPLNNFPFSADTALGAVLTGPNPYASVATYNPTSDLSTIQTRFNTVAAVLDAVDEVSDWEGMFDAAKTKIDTNLDSSSDIETRVENFTNRQRLALSRSYARVSRATSALNLVEFGVYPKELAILEAEHNNKIADYRSQEELRSRESRKQLVAQAVGDMVRIYTMRLSGLDQSTIRQESISRGVIIAQSERIKQDAIYDFEEAMFDLNAFPIYADMVGSMGHGAQRVGGPSGSHKGSDLSNALAGAGVGMEVGSMAGPWGAGIGAAIGGIAGFFG